ncbi:NAD-dependent deacetylase hst3 [Fusarium solani]|nr:NAD-dependent deacetylase hst3 [Fusarium solani]
MITGAGISTNTGIPDYQSTSRSVKSSRILYDSSAYSTPESARNLHADILQKLQSGQKAATTPFDEFAKDLA